MPLENRWVLVRHAPARSRDFARWPDDHGRPLKPSGRKEFREAALGLRSLLGDQGLLATSPLARAQETAELLAEAWIPGRPLRTWPELRPEGDLRELFEKTQEFPKRGDRVLVGHEPELSHFVGYCVTGEAHPLLKFARGGAVALDFPGAVRPGAGRILWVLTRQQLRRLGRAGAASSED